MIDWQTATLIRSEKTASDIQSMFFTIPNWAGHLAGQHCDIRLTAENGYQAQRSYSIASSPSSEQIEFGVQLLSDGEVSPYLWTMKPGDQIEIKGPIGGHFIWEPKLNTDVILIGGGAGIAPLLSIYKHFKDTNTDREITFIESAKSEDMIMYYEQLKNVLITRITKSQGHIDISFLRSHLEKYTKNDSLTYICGPTAFVENTATGLVNIGFNSNTIRTERFG